jgi:DNA helicase-2/ATP-dependent DNA helicase PcrA
MVSADALTPEQQAVVRHDTGPALVMAVPGAGKTTALVHRIRALVTDRRVTPERILACSFSRATVADLSDALSAIGISGVDVRTVHSLGRALREQAGADAPPPDAPAPTDAAYRLARGALRALADDRGEPVAALGLTPEDLVDRVAAWKQQLAYADLEAANLPPAAAAVARAADPDDATALFRRFEARRRRRGWLTYADMLRDGWEGLHHDPDLRSTVQERYRYVLVDEFQDVSRAQFHLLDLVTAAHRNYMAVGDDDQSIYGWRGARPTFLRSFPDRYEASVYRMTASFRLPPAPLVLANRVITQNEERAPKQSTLTHLQGGATLRTPASTAAAADALAARVAQLRSDEDVGLEDMVVLVRTYGQTPPIERALLDHDVPYRVVGASPFYRRRPVQTLLRYLYWAVLEHRRDRRGGFADPQAARQYASRFAYLANHPNRYLPQGFIDVVTREARTENVSVLDRLAAHRDDLPDDTVGAADDLRALLQSLVDQLDRNAGAVLDDLVAALSYDTVLRERRARPRQAEADIRTVRAFTSMAEETGDVRALLQHVRALAADRTDRAPEAPALAIRSIHRAKGAEWPVVFVPGCVEGTLPYAPDEQTEAELAEERRLFYVALTRPRRRLYLFAPEEDAPSRFLEEAQAASAITSCRRVRSALTTRPATLSDAALAHLCAGVVQLGLETFLRDWWTPSPDRAAALADRLKALTDRAEAARQRLARYRDETNAHRERQSAPREEAQTRADTLRSTVGTAPLTAASEGEDRHIPEDARVTFRSTDDGAQVQVLWHEEPVATIHPFDAHRLDAQTLLSLPWAHLVGTVEGWARGRRALRVRLDWPSTVDRLHAAERETLSPPDPPDETTRLLASDDVATGARRLRERLSTLGADA